MTDVPDNTAAPENAQTAEEALAAEAESTEQHQVRLAKRQRMIGSGIAPYPVAVAVTHRIADVREQYAHLESGEETDAVVGVAGRVVFARNTGKLCFASLQSGDGSRIQAMVSLAEVGEESLASWKDLVDLADHVFVTGRVISSRRGELSIMVTDWHIASKALRPMPNLHAELNDETRMRQRYLDLIVRDQARQNVRIRAAVNASMRETFAGHDFTELETPMLQRVHGGASARPFVTHSNAFDTELFLRIAPELYLKRAVVGGLERVFEINRNFRNEGADSTHSPEFAMLEAYEAYGDYMTIADLTQELVQNAALAATGGLEVELTDGSVYDFSGEWQKLPMYESLSEAAGREVTVETSLDELLAWAGELEIEVDQPTHGKLVEELWEHYVKPGLDKPTFVIDFPVDTSPLTAAHRSKPGVVEKWDLYVRGFELATGYSELIDPVDQRERFVAQASLASRGDVEAMPLDEDFLTALEHGMPPSGGMGMGVDRLLMAVTGNGIRETILFPLVK